MSQENYSSDFSVKRTPMEVYDAICRVKDWWTINTDGQHQAVGDEFTVRFGELWKTFRVTRAHPGKQIVWHLTDCHMPWLKDTKEWKDMDIVFDISATNEGARLRMTQIGLVPDMECYDACEDAWGFFLNESLRKAIVTGKGEPDMTKPVHA